MPGEGLAFWQQAVAERSGGRMQIVPRFEGAASGDGGAGRRLWEHLPHFTAIGYAMPVSLTVADRGTLEALPPDLLAAVSDAGARTEVRQWQAVRNRLKANYAQMRANGVSITAEPAPDLRAALARAAEVAIAEWIARAGPEAQQILARYRRP